MKLLDRIALDRALSMILSFILTVIKIFAPHNTGTDSDVIKPNRKWNPKWRKKNE